MSFLIRNKTASPVVINDMGFTIPAGVGSPPVYDFDLTHESANNIASSADLIAAIVAGDLVVLDPLDGVTELSSAISQQIVQVHNDPHYRIRGGTLNQLDDVDLTGSSTGYVLQQNGSGVFVAVTPDDMVGDALSTVNQAISDLFVDGTDTTVVRTGSPVTAIQVNVNDVFLRNTGDTLDSGTLTIASGASVSYASGSSLTIQSGATATVADAPVNATDIVNKAYVDSVAAGLDPKESVRVATTGDVGGSYTTGVITGAVGTIDGVALAPNDRVLVKDQNDPLENGIYYVTAGPSGSPATVTLTRATDHDGTPANEVSSGNFVFVEAGNTWATSGWVVTGDGILTLDTDAINWVQFSESSAYTASNGVDLTGNDFSLDINSVTASGTVALGDQVAFNDVDNSNTTTKSSFQSIFDTLDVVYGVTSNGIVVRTAEDTYTSRTIVADGAVDRAGLEVSNGDGVSGNPTIGLDIENLPYVVSGSPTGAISTTDRVPVFDVDLGKNVYYNVGDIAGALASTNSFETFAISGNSSGASIVAESSTDTATFSGGVGINIDGNATTDTLTFSLDFAAIPAGGSPSVVDSTDELILNNGGTVVKVTVQDLIDTMGLTVDQLTKVSANDTTPGYLDGKLVAGMYTTLTQNNDGGNETLTIDVDPTTIQIADLGDVAVTGVADGDVLMYVVGSPSGWMNVPSSTIPANVCALSAGNTGTLTVADEIAVCDGGSTVKFTFTEVFNTLDVVYGNFAAGIVVKTADDTYTSRSIDVAGVGLGDGLAVTNGDGISGNPTLELDIDGTPAAGEDFAADDEIIAVNTSATANQKFTGQEVADGVATMLGISGLTIKAIGGSGSPGEQQLFMTDTARSKDLSVAEFTVTFSESTVGLSDWMEVGGASDATSGFVMPYNATIVRAMVHCASASGSKDLDLYVDGTPTTAFLTVPSGSDQEVVDGTKNVDVNAGQKIRMRGSNTLVTLGDTVVTLWLRWR